MKRKSGILLHPTSLPGKHGIGTLGIEAYKFIDFLEKSKQKIWQIFPLGPTGYGDSPYQCFSAYAANPYLIDLDQLVEYGLLTKEEIDLVDLGSSNYIDYGKIYYNKLPLLKKAFDNYKKDNNKLKFIFNKFKEKEAYWLDNYALFMALKDYFGGVSWTEWEDEVKFREEKALNEYKNKLEYEIEYVKFIQFIAYKQWLEVKEYANNKGIQIIGDIPIFVAFDSSDAWANPEIFLFDKDKNPVKVAGVPPDYFSATGQLWGNPLYDWDYIKKDGYKWWINRIKFNLNIADIIRIDHFRGFESYWAVPYGEETALNGQWEKGPGIELFEKIKDELGDLPIIAEDLGILTDEVIELKNNTGFPGMKILQFAFDGSNDNIYLPHMYEENTIVYTGTHDNDTTNGWYWKLSDSERWYIRNYLDIENDVNLNWNLIKQAWRSKANIAIAPIQDFLGFGSETRLNTPGLAAGNWQWRLEYGMLNDELIEKIADITKLYNR